MTWCVLPLSRLGSPCPRAPVPLLQSMRVLPVTERLCGSRGCSGPGPGTTSSSRSRPAGGALFELSSVRTSKWRARHGPQRDLCPHCCPPGCYPRCLHLPVRRQSSHTPVPSTPGQHPNERELGGVPGGQMPSAPWRWMMTFAQRGWQAGSVRGPGGV